MCSCGSPGEAVVIMPGPYYGPGKSSATKSCLYVWQEAIAEDKVANDNSFINSTFRKLFTNDLRESTTLPNWQL